MPATAKPRNNVGQRVVRLKVVVRRLPAHLPEDVFWKSVESWVTPDTVTWKLYCPGKFRKEINSTKPTIPSRAYVAFKTEEQVVEFSNGFNGHTFRDKQGRESQAVVEFAPFQKIPPPPERIKPDQRLGTIEQDEDYKSFLASLDAPPEPIVQPSTLAPQETKLTPLLESLIAEKTILKSKHPVSNDSKPVNAKVSRNQKDAVANAKEDKGKAKGGAPPPESTPEPKSKKAAKKEKGKAGPQSSTAAAPPPTANPPKQVIIAKQPKATPTTPNAKLQRPPAQANNQVHNQQVHVTPRAPPAPTPTPAVNTSTQVPKAGPGRNNRQPPAKKLDPTPAPPKPAPNNVKTEIGKVDEHPEATPASTTTTPAPAPSRRGRGRPMIGIASRQFEAALSHVGVVAPRKRDAAQPASQNQKKATDNSGPTT